MATSKKPVGNRNGPARVEAEKTTAGKAKPATRGRAKPSTQAKAVRAEVARAVMTPGVEEVVRVPVDPSVASPSAAVEAVREVSHDLAEVGRELRGARQELRALRTDREAAAKELAELRAQLRSVAKEAADGLAGLARLRAEAQAAVAHVADLKHACRKSGEELRTEVGDESVVLVRLRQVREQADEVVREAAGAGQRIRAFREECERAAKAADVLHLQARAAYLESLAEVLKGVERVKGEVARLEGRLAGLRHDAEQTTASAARSASAAGTPAESENRLGVAVDPGVVIAEVLPDGLAAAAGLARGDVVESVNGTPVHSPVGLRDAILSLPEGSEVTVRIRRGGDPLLMVGRLSPTTREDGNRLGLVVGPGVVVAGVMPGSPAAAAGLVRGDVIERAAGQEIHDGEHLRTAVQTVPAGAEVTLSVTHDGEVREVVARLDRPGERPPPLAEMEDTGDDEDEDEVDEDEEERGEAPARPRSSP